MVNFNNHNYYLHQGDCVEFMTGLPNNSVTMIWTDPPYGNKNHENDLNSSLNAARHIDNKPILNDDAVGMMTVVDGMLMQAARVMHVDCCCCCCCCGGGGPSPRFAWLANRMDRDGLEFYHSVIWDKKNPGLGWRYRRQYEHIMIAHRMGGQITWNPDRSAQRNIYSLYPPSRNREHPNEKPTKLIKHFVTNHTKPGDVVLDPFMGSGSTGVACMETGREFIGCELDSDYFKIAEKRIYEATRQQRLF